MRYILHIGTEKTGTTTLQYFLARHRKHLATRGICYPRTCGLRSHGWLPLLGYPADRRDDLTARAAIHDARSFTGARQCVREGLAGELANHARRGGHTAVLCSEHLHSRLDDHDVLRLCGELTDIGIRDPTVVVYLRDPLAAITSRYRTLVANGGTDSPYEGGDPSIRILCDHAATLARWQRAFNAQNVIARAFDRTWLVNRSIVDDFAAVTDLNFTGLKRFRDLNSSVSEAALEIMRGVNAILHKECAARGRVPMFDLLGTLGRAFPGPPFTLPVDVAAMALAEFEDARHLVFDLARAQGPDVADVAGASPPPRAAHIVPPDPAAVADVARRVAAFCRFFHVHQKPLPYPRGPIDRVLASHGYAAVVATLLQAMLRAHGPLRTRNCQPRSARVR